MLLKNNVLILSNGCASFPLMKLGYCNTSALAKTGGSMKAVADMKEKRKALGWD